MKNLVSRFYQAVDDTLVKTADVAAKGYRHVTGGSKADLADKLLGLSGLAMAGSGFFSEELPMYFLSGSLLGVGRIISEFNYDEYSDEVKCNVATRDDEKARITLGGLTLLCSGLMMGLGILEEYSSEERAHLDWLGNLSASLSFALFSASMYVMRTEPVKRQDNILQRYRDRKNEE
jgi:hypothetical protein